VPKLRYSLLLIALTAPLAAGDSASLKAYMALKQDSSLYVGEGTAGDREFSGDHANALAAARERARAALAESVSVRVRSVTSESQESAGGSVKESVQSRSQSVADLKLDSVKLMELDQFPEAGQVTVLASLSKEDYRRQLAGEGPAVFHPESALRLLGGEAFKQDWQIGTDKDFTGFYGGLEVDWHDFMVGFQYGYFTTGTSSYNPSYPAFAQPTPATISQESLQIGYNWTWFNWRLQPYLPMHLEGTDFQWAYPNGSVLGISGNQTKGSGLLFGGVTGLGLRYWIYDGLAVDLTGLFHIPFNSIPGPTQIYAPVSNGHFSTESLDVQLGITWSGF
jgi:hypothetical protein